MNTQKEAGSADDTVPPIGEVAPLGVLPDLTDFHVLDLAIPVTDEYLSRVDAQLQSEAARQAENERERIAFEEKRERSKQSALETVRTDLINEVKSDSDYSKLWEPFTEENLGLISALLSQYWVNWGIRKKDVFSRLTKRKHREAPFPGITVIRPLSAEDWIRMISDPFLFDNLINANSSSKNIWGPEGIDVNLVSLDPKVKETIVQVYWGSLDTEPNRFLINSDQFVQSNKPVSRMYGVISLETGKDEFPRSKLEIRVFYGQDKKNIYFETEETSPFIYWTTLVPLRDTTKHNRFSELQDSLIKTLIARGHIKVKPPPGVKIKR
jgi:hypothetical protein